MMLLILLIFGAAIGSANAQGGYEAYGGAPTATESAKTGGEYEGGGAKVPVAPIDPPRLNAADADLLSEAAAHVSSAPIANDNSNNNNDNNNNNNNDSNDTNNNINDNNNSSISMTLHNEQEFAHAAPSGGGPSLGYRPPPPPTRREAESMGQCSFDSARWSMEPQSAISQAIMFDRTTGLSCEECLKKCSEEYQDHSTPWVCRSLTYDNEWKICDLFAINGTETPYFLTEFDGRDYFAYLAALPPTDEQLKSKKIVADKTKSDSTSSSAEKEKKELRTQPSSAAVQLSNQLSAASAADVTASPCIVVDVTTTTEAALKVSASSSLVTEAPSLPSAVSQQQYEVTASQAEEQQQQQNKEQQVQHQQQPEQQQQEVAPSLSANTAASESLYGASVSSEATTESTPEVSSAETSNTANSATSSEISNAAANAESSSHSNSDATALKSYAAKTQKQRDGEKNQFSEILSAQNETISTLLPTEDLKTANRAAQLSDFQLALQKLKQESEVLGKAEEEISGATGDENKTLIGDSLKSPKLIKIGKKTTTTIVRSSSTSGNNETAPSKSLKASIHTISSAPSVENGQENSWQKFADAQQRQPSSILVQETISEKFESASSSSSASSASSSASSFKSQSSTSSNSESSLPIVSQSTNSSAERAQKTESVAQSDASSLLSSCAANELSRFISFEGFGRPHHELHIAKLFAAAKSIEECVDACDSQRLQACMSLVFSVERGCELYSQPINYNNSDSLQRVANSYYVQKFCITAKKAQAIRKISPAVPNHILVGHVQEVTDAKSFLDCQLSCLNTELEFGFTCKSAMWYPLDNDQNCLLNAESRHTQPDVFVTEDPDVVMLYFEQIPEKTQSALKIKAIQQMMRFRDLPLQVERRLLGKMNKKSEVSKWTRWSACKKDEGVDLKMRVRYMKCAGYKDVRKCPKETMLCARNDVQINLNKAANETTDARVRVEASIDAGGGECRAVRDALGRKHCPYGMRLKEGGQREFCKRPVDCP